LPQEYFFLLNGHFEFDAVDLELSKLVPPFLDDSMYLGLLVLLELYFPVEPAIELLQIVSMLFVVVGLLHELVDFVVVLQLADEDLQLLFVLAHQIPEGFYGVYQAMVLGFDCVELVVFGPLDLPRKFFDVLAQVLGTDIGFGQGLAFGLCVLPDGCSEFLNTHTHLIGIIND
jgi:hypothetical protein